MRKWSFWAATLLIAVACGRKSPAALSAGEKVLIGEEGIMRVLSVTDAQDSTVLRTECADFRAKDLKSAAYQRLAQRMVATVTDPSQDGVGIAGPQVGISRRVVAVMRFDKPGTPFEVYPNIVIEEYSEQTQVGPEGCLSVPDVRGDVERAQTVVIRYTCLETLETVRDTVSGYTAVIFQHETDHLDGVLFTDRMSESL